MPPLEYETFGMWISIPLVIRDGNYTSKGPSRWKTVVGVLENACKVYHDRLVGWQ